MRTPQQFANQYFRMCEKVYASGRPTYDAMVALFHEAQVEAMAQAVEEFREKAAKPFDREAERLRKEDERLNSLEIAEQRRYAKRIRAMPNPYQPKESA